MDTNYAVVLSPAFSEIPQYWDGKKFNTETDFTSSYCYTKGQAESELQEAKNLMKKNKWMGEVYIDKRQVLQWR